MGKASRRVRSTDDSRRMQTKWDFYYWNELPMNDGKLLSECMESYGVGGWCSKEKDMIAAFVFLSAEKTASKSWLLGIKHLNGVQGRSTQYERGPGCYRLSLKTSLGAQITGALRGTVFERA